MVKGAIEVLVRRCAQQLDGAGDVVEVGKEKILEHANAMAGRGLRVLAFAYREMESGRATLDHGDVEDGLVFAGLQGMLDPPREGVIEAVAMCRSAGIKVKMITGDHVVTARTIAAQIGIEGEKEVEALDGAELEELSDEDLAKRVEGIAVFARVAPEQKIRLVKCLQGLGHVVAMTGDGVNDAPALKQADIGTAMGITGTDVSKEASDMILTDDNFASIEAAVEEGRGVFDNLTKFIVWTLPTNFGEGLVILFAIIAGNVLPILPVQILWINMTTAVLLGLMLVFEPKEEDIMKRRPRDQKEPILTKRLQVRILFVSLILLAGCYLLFNMKLAAGASLEEARTVAVNVFVIVEMFYLFNCRSFTSSVFKLGLFSNPWLLGGAAVMILLQMVFTYVPFMNAIFQSAPISAGSWLWIFGVGLAAYLLVGLEKLISRKILVGR